MVGGRSYQIQGEAEITGVAWPAEEKVKGEYYYHLQLPDGKVQRRLSQTLPRGAQ